MSRKSSSRKRPSSIDRTLQKHAAPAPPRRPLRGGFRRRSLLLVGLLFFLGVLFWSLGGPTRVTTHFAERAIQERDFSAARDWLAWGQRVSPGDPAHFFWAARIARHEGELARMSDLLDRARQSGFDPERVSRERVLAQAQTGRLNGIESKINQWLSGGASEAREISDAYANGLAAGSRFPSALRILEAWHQDYPDDPIPLYRIGRIDQHFQRLEEAKEKYRAAIARDEDCFPALYSLAGILLDEKRAEEALARYRRCLAMSEPAAARIGIARCMIALGETDRARETLSDVVQMDRQRVAKSYRAVGEVPERFVAAAELGKLEVSAGNFQEGKRWLDLAIGENPRDVAARYSRAVALRGLGKAEAADAEFERVRDAREALEKVNTLRNRIHRDPGDIEARIALGELLLQYESERAGLFWLRSVLAHDADNRKVHRKLAEYYQDHVTESPQHARLAREHAAQVSPDHDDEHLPLPDSRSGDAGGR